MHYYKKHDGTVQKLDDMAREVMHNFQERVRSKSNMLQAKKQDAQRGLLDKFIFIANFSLIKNDFY